MYVFSLRRRECSILMIGEEEPRWDRPHYLLMVEVIEPLRRVVASLILKPDTNGSAAYYTQNQVTY